MLTETLNEKVKETVLRLQKKRAEQRLQRKARKDQIVILTIDSDGNVLDIHNEWNSEHHEKPLFIKSTPCNFISPVDKGKTITWIGIPENEEDKISIENIVMTNANGTQVLRNRSYIRGNTGIVTGKVKDNNIKVGEQESYYLTYKVNDDLFVLDPILEIH